MSKILNKFTKLKYAIKILESKQFVLANPFGWEDQNDINCLKKYKDYKNAKTILASCLVDGRERYHHWKIYANGQEGDEMGVCIEFDRINLINCFQKANFSLEGKDGLLRFDNVGYRWIKGFNIESKEDKGDLINYLPFRKRKTYGDEKEYRIIYENYKKVVDIFTIPIEKDTITRITLSPYANERNLEDLKEYIKKLKYNYSINFNISGMLNHPKWQKILSSITY